MHHLTDLHEKHNEVEMVLMPILLMKKLWLIEVVSLARVMEEGFKHISL